VNLSLGKLVYCNQLIRVLLCVSFILSQSGLAIELTAISNFGLVRSWLLI
jgi:hypothetical protein